MKANHSLRSFLNILVRTCHDRANIKASLLHTEKRKNLPDRVCARTRVASGVTRVKMANAFSRNKEIVRIHINTGYFARAALGCLESPRRQPSRLIPARSLR